MRQIGGAAFNQVVQWESPELSETNLSEDQRKAVTM
jgi:hypothetical protein